MNMKKLAYVLIFSIIVISGCTQQSTQQSNNDVVNVANCKFLKDVSGLPLFSKASGDIGNSIIQVTVTYNKENKEEKYYTTVILAVMKSEDPSAIQQLKDQANTAITSGVAEQCSIGSISGICSESSGGLVPGITKSFIMFDEKSVKNVQYQIVPSEGSIAPKNITSEDLSPFIEMLKNCNP